MSEQEHDTAVLREHDEQQARVLAEAPRFQGHPVGCQCARCAVVLLRSLGLDANLGRPMESSPHVRRALDRSHEGSAA